MRGESDSDPHTDAEARLRQIRDDVDALLDGQEVQHIDGHTAGTLDEISGVLFALHGRETDVRVTQEPVDEPPAPAFCMLGYLLDGMAAASGRTPRQVAQHAIATMEQLKRSDGYDRTASVTGTEEDDGD